MLLSWSLKLIEKENANQRCEAESDNYLIPIRITPSSELPMSGHRGGGDLSGPLSTVLAGCPLVIDHLLV
jgi:hypothetical protein